MGMDRLIGTAGDGIEVCGTGGWPGAGVLGRNGAALLVAEPPAVEPTVSGGRSG